MSTHAATPLVSQADIDRLAGLYTFRERDEVVSFLEENPFLVALLLEIPNKIGVYFLGSPLFVELLCDPESSEGDCQIMVYIATNLPLEEALATLDRFDEDYGIDYLVRGQMKLNIDVEFR